MAEYLKAAIFGLEAVAALIVIAGVLAAASFLMVAVWVAIFGPL